MHSLIRLIPSVFLALLAGLALANPKAGDPTAAGVVGQDEQDLVFFQAKRPYRFRIHLQIKGRSFQAAWTDTMKHLFDYLDVDRDGVLNAAELRCAPSAAQWHQMLRGTSALEPDPAPDFAAVDCAPADGKITFSELSVYYRRAGAGPLQVEWGWRIAPDRLSDALFARLDQDKDGKLSQKELLATATVLHRLDTNQDEMVSVHELVPTFYESGFQFRLASDPEPVPVDFPLLLLHPGDPLDRLAKELLSRYDRDKNGKLSPSEIGLEKASFAKLDTNSDGQLDVSELERWVNLPPDLETILHFDEGTPSRIAILAGSQAKQVRTSRTGSLFIPLGDHEIELLRLAPPSRDPKARKQSFFSQYRANGKDKDRVITSREIYQPPFTLVPLLRLADRNGDGKLNGKEINDFVDLQERVVATTTYVTITDRGRTLFEMLDTDRDSRLGPREMRSAWTRLEPWVPAGGLTRQTIPHQYQLSFAYGQVWPVDQQMNLLGYGRATPVGGRGPLWFQKMDRNGDGDISPAEFLGTLEQFRQLDTDGDGLIDVQEAEKADHLLRKP
jgi:Ca2+-binding EF-hand superfamily protein